MASEFCENQYGKIEDPKIRFARKISKMIGIMIGLALTISAVVVISAVSVSFGHENEVNSMIGSDMMSGNMMHSMMMKENGGMMSQIDKDGDGLCDYCGMSIETCRRMMS